MRIDVLVLDGVFDLGLAAVLDAFQTANELAEVARLDVPRFEVRAIGVRRRVTSAQGLRVPVEPSGRRRPDCVLVPAIGYKMPGPLETALARPDVQEAASALRSWRECTNTIAAACIGTFVLAESGVLDGQQAEEAPVRRKGPAEVSGTRRVEVGRRREGRARSLRAVRKHNVSQGPAAGHPAVEQES